MLQCFDGYRDGATAAEIAQVVFRIIAQLDREAWRDASARHAIKIPCCGTRAMIAGAIAPCCFVIAGRTDLVLLRLPVGRF